MSTMKICLRKLTVAALLMGTARLGAQIQVEVAPPVQVPVGGGVVRVMRGGAVMSIAVPEPAAATTETAKATTDILKFRNGDVLHGMMTSVVPETGIRWRHTDVKEIIGFDLANLSDVLLLPRPLRLPRAGHHVTVELTNGDRLLGDIETFNDKLLVLKTWYAGTLSIKRPMVQRITPAVARSEVMYVGPTSIEGWIVGGNRGAWIYKKGAFNSASYGSIGRDVKLPDMANIEFDINWRGQLSFQFGMYLTDLNQMFSGGGYMLQFNYSNVYLQRSRPNAGFNNLGSPVDVPELPRKSRAHIAVKVNKPKKMIALFINGTMVKQWTDTDDFAGKGTGVMFCSQGQGQCRINNILVAEWDGKLDSDTTGPAASTEDMILLANGDKVSGTLSNVASNEITFVTSYAPLKLPMERVAMITLATQKAEKPRRQANDVRAFFTDTARLTLALEKIDEQTVTGTSENCGRISAGLEAFSRIQFNIYQPRTDTATDDDWGNAETGNDADAIAQ